MDDFKFCHPCKGSQYQDGEGKMECNTAPECDAGQFLQMKTASTSDGGTGVEANIGYECVDCPKGLWSLSQSADSTIRQVHYATPLSCPLTLDESP